MHQLQTAFPCPHMDFLPMDQKYFNFGSHLPSKIAQNIQFCKSCSEAAAPLNPTEGVYSRAIISLWNRAVIIPPSNGCSVEDRQLGGCSDINTGIFSLDFSPLLHFWTLLSQHRYAPLLPFLSHGKVDLFYKFLSSLALCSIGCNCFNCSWDFQSVPLESPFLLLGVWWGWGAARSSQPLGAAVTASLPVTISCFLFKKYSRSSKISCTCINASDISE